MKFKVLGCSGAELPGYNPPAFLLDGKVLLDAGTIGTSLTEGGQKGIRDILITHAHLDHIRAIPSLADNLVITHQRHSVRIFGIGPTLKDLRTHLLNDRLWPDFTRISASIEPVLQLLTVPAGREFRVNGYAVRAYPVDHTVPAVGYVISDGRGRTLLYTGDTGPTERIWRADRHIHAAVIEVSFPNEMGQLARVTGHLTPDLLRDELKKMKRTPDRIYVTHPKPQFIRKIRTQVAALRRQTGTAIEILKDGETYRV